MANRSQTRGIIRPEDCQKSVEVLKGCMEEASERDGATSPNEVYSACRGPFERMMFCAKTERLRKAMEGRHAQMSASGPRGPEFANDEKVKTVKIVVRAEMPTRESMSASLIGARDAVIKEARLHYQGCAKTWEALTSPSTPAKYVSVVSRYLDGMRANMKLIAKLAKPDEN